MSDEIMGEGAAEETAEEATEELEGGEEPEAEGETAPAVEE